MTEEEMYDGFFDWVNATCPVFTIPKIGNMETLQWRAEDIVCMINDVHPGKGEFYINLVFEEWAQSCGYTRTKDGWERKNG